MRLFAPTKKHDEEPLVNLSFNIHKFNNRPKPSDKRRILIISSFSEFGCETVSCMYAIPRLVQQHPGYYVIVMGWYGRAYMYKHLVDEFWELKEEFQWLRDYAKAFHNESKNLERLEETAKEYGIVYPCRTLAKDVVLNWCQTCQKAFKMEWAACPHCKNGDFIPAFFTDIPFWKRFAIRIPRPSKEKFEAIAPFMKPKTVGVVARGRKTYGRNLQPEFYVKLIKVLEQMGYNPIWLGEKQSTQPCPVDHIVDFSRMPDSGDLEKTLAIVCGCEFTIQFWTASTRLAGMMGVPYLLFESPDQIFGNGQEGYRRNLCDFGPAKLCISHYLNVYNNHAAAMKLVKKCVKDIERGDFNDVVGLVEREEVVTQIREANLERIGGRVD
jgi:hypothetical protein